MATPQASKKRKAYSFFEKLHVIDRIRKGETQAKVSKEIGVPDSTIRGWLKDEDKLRKDSMTFEDSGHVRKRARHAQDPQLDKAMFAWFNQARSEGVPLSGPVIQTQAKKMHQELRGEETEFGATTGWLQRFKSRHSICMKIGGEQRSADEEADAHKKMTDEEILASEQQEDETTSSVKEEEKEGEEKEKKKEEEEIVHEPPPAVSEALKCLETALRWFESSECGTVSSVTALRNLLHEARKVARKTASQKQMTDYFKKQD